MLDHMLTSMWNDYVDLNPEAARVFSSFRERGEKITNDHIALRTFKHPKLGIEQLARVFKSLGYEEKGEYFFADKKLYAKHYENSIDPNLPKIFISELEIEHFSLFLRDQVHQMVAQIPEEYFYRKDFSYIGRPWKISYENYQRLAQESEYASWIAALGFRPNHFTVNVNSLTTFSDLQSVNSFIKSKGFKLNGSGGEIKGSREDYLEQSSTMAGVIDVEFEEGSHKVPACYYEFALRYPLKNGKLYQGFVAKSADKIFESTDRR